MIQEDDWRLNNQEKYLQGVTLYFRRWTLDDPSWDHDHCEFCWLEFSNCLPDTLAEGYTTDDRYRWICPTCFSDFKERFQWTVGD